MRPCNEMAFFPSNFMLQTCHEEDNPATSLNPILPSCTPREIHGVTSFLGRRSMSFSGVEETNGCDDDLSDDGSQAGEKKKRLNIEQVKTLEKSFETGNKLEPERKMQLAGALGLQPRQIAIWFQNRRARWKTKQLEKDFDLLKKQFEAIKAENDVLQAENKKLQEEIMALKSKEISEPINLNKETEGSCSNRSENSLDINLDSSLSSHPNIPMFASMRPSNVAQLLQNSSRSEIHCPKIEHSLQEESFTNMFLGVDDQTGFWPWAEHHNFH